MCDTPPSIENNVDALPQKLSSDLQDENNAFEDLDAVLGIDLEGVDNADVDSVLLSSNTLDKNNENFQKAIVISSRSTRSRDNPEFVAKQKLFFAKVQAATSGAGMEANIHYDTPNKRKRETSVNSQFPRKRKKLINKSENNQQEYMNDNCCWECHKEGTFICCEMCPRVFHLKCAGMEKEPEEDWACSECHAVMQAENVENRSRAMQMISVDQLCILLRYALKRLMSLPMLEPFLKPVDVTQFPTYPDMVIHAVDFTSLERNINRKFYGSTEAFLSDARWIHHNSVIFNGANSKVTSLARTLIKVLKQELSEIETCPDCYQNAHQKPDTWFKEACRMAHPIVWARLKGFPFWPAKAVKWKEGNVDVRFFGRHDRSWVALKECFLFSEQMPTPLKNRNKTLESCLVEVSDHIKKLAEKFGKFKYAPHRLPFNPYEIDQIKLLLPFYKGPSILKVKGQIRSSSRQSRHSGTDDETSSVASTDSGTSSGRLNRIGKRAKLYPCHEMEAEEDASSYQDEVESNNVDEDNSKIDDGEFDSELKDEELGPETRMEDVDCLEETYTSESLVKRLAIDMNPDVEEMAIIESQVNTPKCEYSEDVTESLERKMPVEANLEMEDSHVDINDKTEENDLNISLVQLKSNPKSSPVLSLAKHPTKESDTGSHFYPNNDASDDNSEKFNVEDNLNAISTLLSESSKLVPAQVIQGRSSAFAAGTLSSNGQDSPESDSSESKLEIVVPESKDFDNESSLELNEECNNQKENFKAFDSAWKCSSGEELKSKSADNVCSENNAGEDSDTNNDGTDLCNISKNEPSINGIEKNVGNIEAILNINNPTSHLVTDTDNDGDQMDKNTPEVNSTKSIKESTSTSPIFSTNQAEIIDENIRNLERLNELLQREEEELDEIETQNCSNVTASIENKGIENTDNDKIQGTSVEDNSKNEKEPDESKTTKDNNPSNEKIATQLIANLTNLNEIATKKTQDSELSEDDYFQGFLNDISYRKKLENYKELFKSIQMADFDESEVTDTEELDEPDSDKMEYEDEINDQILNRSSISVNKLILPKTDSIHLENLSTENLIKSVTNFSSVNISRLLVEKDFTAKSGDKKETPCDLKPSGEGNVTTVGLKAYTDKILHNVTIRSRASELMSKDSKQDDSKLLMKGLSSRMKERSLSLNSNDDKCSNDSSNSEDKKVTESASKLERNKNNESDSLLEAVRLVQNIGNIAIKRVDNKTLEHTSGNDKITISVTGSSNATENLKEKPQPKRIEKRHDSRENNPLPSIGSSVSVTKASDKDKKVKMPSGVDTTRLSPSISIIPVSSSASERPKYKISMSPSISQGAHVTATTSTTTVASASKSASPTGGSSTPSSSISASPNIPPPPLLSHPLPSPTGAIRGLFGPHLPGLNLQGGPRTPITSPGLRMMGASPGIIMGNRLPGAAQVIRHLPPEAGPLSTELHKHAHKLAEMMRTSLEEVLGGLVGLGTPEARLAALQLELERCNWRHQQELAEVRHNADVMLVEMRANLEAEKQRAVEEVRRQMELKLTEIRRQLEVQMTEKITEVKKQGEIDKQRGVEETKKKQWCANCSKEALFFCCWNTSYCDYPCQQAHWPQHMTVCGQNSEGGGGGNNTAGNNSQAEALNENINGDAVTHVSRVTTPVQNLIGVQFDEEEDVVLAAEDRNRKYRIENPSQIYPDGTTALVNSNMTQAIVPGANPLGQTIAGMGHAGIRTHITNPAMPMSASAINAGSHGAAAMTMKMPRFNIIQQQHNIIQQQPMFGGMDPRMMMMMSRNMPAAAMMRSHMQPFRPRFM